MDKATAIQTLRTCGVSAADDFHRLNSDQVESLLAAARLFKYRKPRNANGSRARYFHAYLVRIASRP